MITKRLQEYFRFKGLSYYKVEKTLQVSTGSISGAIKHQRNIGSKVLQKILIVYSDLSAEWLLRGKGKMTLKAGSQSDQEDHIYQVLSNDWLIDRTVRFFNLKSKHELISFFERIYAQDAPEGKGGLEYDQFEKIILDVVEKKYGSTLANAEELYALYLQKIMREGENLLNDDSEEIEGRNMR